MSLNGRYTCTELIFGYWEGCFPFCVVHDLYVMFSYGQRSLCSRPTIIELRVLEILKHFHRLVNAPPSATRSQMTTGVKYFLYKVDRGPTTWAWSNQPFHGRSGPCGWIPEHISFISFETGKSIGLKFTHRTTKRGWPLALLAMKRSRLCAVHWMICWRKQIWLMKVGNILITWTMFFPLFCQPKLDKLWVIF